MDRKFTTPLPRKLRRLTPKTAHGNRPVRQVVVTIAMVASVIVAVATVRAAGSAGGNSGDPAGRTAAPAPAAAVDRDAALESLRLEIEDLFTAERRDLEALHDRLGLAVDEETALAILAEIARVKLTTEKRILEAQLACGAFERSPREVRRLRDAIDDLVALGASDEPRPVDKRSRAAREGER